MAQFLILVIEDDPAVSQSLHSALTREGYEVICKIEGGEALTYAKKSPLHLILLDARLPDGSVKWGVRNELHARQATRYPENLIQNLWLSSPLQAAGYSRGE